MRKLLQNKHGFTLVELMVTIVIVGVLAAVAIPLYRANVKKAIAAEADAALGTIRTEMRVYYSEKGYYPTATDAYPWNITDVTIDSIDVVGKYFPATAYKVTSTTSSYTIQATGSGDSNGINRQMVTDGTLSDF